MSRDDPTYWRVSPKFWRHALVHGWSEDARQLAFYLLTCPHRTTEGLYWLPTGYMASDLAWVTSRVEATLAELEAQDFVRYDAEASIVLMPKAMKYQRPDNPNQVKAAIRHLEELPKTCLFAAFLEAADRYAQPLAQALRKGLPQGYTYPLALALAPALTQELPPDSGESCVDLSEDFERWWKHYGRIGSKADALGCYLHWRKHGASEAELTLAATRYLAHCRQTQTSIKHAATFLAKKPNRWKEWADGEEHGSMAANAAPACDSLGSVVGQCPNCGGDLRRTDDAVTSCQRCGPGQWVSQCYGPSIWRPDD
jgi:hypothetical protein